MNAKAVVEIDQFPIQDNDHLPEPDAAVSFRNKPQSTRLGLLLWEAFPQIDAFFNTR